MNGWELGDARNAFIVEMRCFSSPSKSHVSCAAAQAAPASGAPFGIGRPAARQHASIHRAEPVWRVWRGLGTRLSSGRVCIQLCGQHRWWPVWRRTSKPSGALWRSRCLWHLEHTDKSAEPQGQGQEVIRTSSHGLAYATLVSVIGKLAACDHL